MKFLLLFLSVVQTVFAVAQIQLNTSFGSGGVVKISLDDFTEPVNILKLNSDSLLLLSNLTHSDSVITTDFAITKLNADGEIDLQFGQSGTVLYDFNGMDVSSANSFLILDDGKILVLGAGHSISNPSFIPLCLMKLFADGKIDSSFGNNGTLNLQFDGIEEFPRVIKKVANGKLLIGGFSTDSSHIHVDVPAISRMNENGTLDSTFGINGKTYLRFPNGIISANRHAIGGVLYDLLELSNGSYLACGGYSSGLNLIGYIAYLNHDGSIDTAHLDQGYVAYDFTPFANSQIIKMKQDANGLIWFGATSASLQGKNFYVGNLNLINSDFNSSAIDFNGNEDAVADIQFDVNGNPFFIGKTISPQHTSSAYQSDYFAVDFSPVATFPFNGQQFTFSEDTALQCGAVNSVFQNNGNLICYGFKNKLDGKSELMLIAINVQHVSSVKEEREEDFLKVFPNPSRGKIFVQTEEQLKEIMLTDITGREVIVIRNNISSSLTLDVSHLAKGAYLLRATNGDKNSMTKVVIE